jgi:hypothetical protein
MAISPAHAQDRPAVPHAPYLARVPDNGHWSITLTYPSATPTTASEHSSATKLNSDQPVTIDVERGDGFSATTFSFQSAPTVRVDAEGGYSFLPGPTGPLLYNAGCQFPISFYTTSFLFSEWLRQQGSSAFDKMIVYHGVPTFHYVNHRPPPHTNLFDAGYGSEVWVNVKTMLPVASKWDGIEADFTYLPPPNSPPQLSPEEIALIQYKANITRAVDSIR